MNMEIYPPPSHLPGTVLLNPRVREDGKSYIRVMDTGEHQTFDNGPFFDLKEEDGKYVVERYIDCRCELVPGSRYFNREFLR